MIMMETRFCILLLTLFSITQLCIAQDTLRIEDIRANGRKKINNSEKKQNRFKDKIYKDSYSDLSKSLDPYLFKIETQYQLKKDGTVYGTEDSPYFGRVFGLGISMERKSG